MRNFAYSLFAFLIFFNFATNSMEPNQREKSEEVRRNALVEKVKKLVADGIDRIDNRILFEVIPSGRADAIELLLKSGMNRELPQKFPGPINTVCTPLICAIHYDTLPIVKLLMQLWSCDQYSR